MVRPTPLQAAAAAYAAARWETEDWRQFGRETGTSDILDGHHRLYRSLGFGDDDYPDAALEVMGRLLAEGTEEGSGEQGRMELLADAMPDLPQWVAAEAPARTRRLFNDYLAGRDSSELPMEWMPTNGEAVSPDQPSIVVAGARLPIVGGIERSTVEPPEPVLYDPAPVDLTATGAILAEPERETPSRIFIVHGHDLASMNSIRVYVLRETGTLPISLAEEPGQGRTIIEKFEAYGDEAAYVIVLLTPDDVGQTAAAAAAEEAPQGRARQNVVLELGYFIGKLGRANVVVVDAGVERPSDLAGLSYVGYPGDNWMDHLRTELKAAGLTT